MLVSAASKRIQKGIQKKNLFPQGCAHSGSSGRREAQPGAGDTWRGVCVGLRAQRAAGRARDRCIPGRQPRRAAGHAYAAVSEGAGPHCSAALGPVSSDTLCVNSGHAQHPSALAAVDACSDVPVSAQFTGKRSLQTDNGCSCLSMHYSQDHIRGSRAESQRGHERGG